MEGFHWRRQHPIGPYLADFACIKAKLIVELDGNSHDHRQDADQNRDATLKEWNWTTLRIANRDLMRNPEGVWQTIAAHLALYIEKLDFTIHTAGNPSRNGPRAARLVH